MWNWKRESRTDMDSMLDLDSPVSDPGASWTYRPVNEIREGRLPPRLVPVDGADRVICVTPDRYRTRCQWAEDSFVSLNGMWADAVYKGRPDAARFSDIAWIELDRKGWTMPWTGGRIPYRVCSFPPGENGYAQVVDGDLVMQIDDFDPGSESFVPLMPWMIHWATPLAPCEERRQPLTVGLEIGQRTAEGVSWPLTGGDWLASSVDVSRPIVSGQPGPQVVITIDLEEPL